MSGTCVAVGAAIGAIIGGGSSISGIRKWNKSLIKAFQKQMYYMQMNYNYNQNALDRQERGAYDAAVGELFSLSVSANQNNASVYAAVNEQSYEGRTADQIKRTVSGTTERQKRAVKDSYEEDVYNIRSQKDALYVQMKAGVEQAREELNSQFVTGSQAWSQVIGGAIQGAALGAATGGAASAAAGVAGGAIGGTSSSFAVAGTSGVGGAAGTMGGEIAGASLSGTTAAGMGMTSGTYLSTYASTFGSTFAKLYAGYGSKSMGYSQMASLASSGVREFGGSGTNTQYKYRRY